RLPELLVFLKEITTLAPVCGATFLTPTTFSKTLVSLSVNLAGSAAFRLPGSPSGPPKRALPGITWITSRSKVENWLETPEYSPSPTESITTIAKTPMIIPREDMSVLKRSLLNPREMNSSISCSLILATQQGSGSFQILQDDPFPPSPFFESLFFR